jgi:uncharacterized protein (DUF1697 family)
MKSLQTYIAILRGINVSGQKKINMNDLAKLLAELNFEDIRTYIQSGNIIFKYSKTDHKILASNIAKKIFEKYKFETPVLIRTCNELEDIIKINPFLKEKNIDIEKLHVTFLSDLPEKTNIEKIPTANLLPDRFKISGKEVYVFCPSGYGRTKLNNNFFENKLKVTATTRNWNTVNELLKMAKEK